MKHITGKTINEVVYKSLDALISEGYRSPSRNGDISTIYNAFVEIENPRSRHLSLVGRDSNIFATIAETFWVFAGDNAIDPYLQFFLPRARDYADDGETWRGGYPERIKNGNQIDDVIQQFRNEGLYTRRAVTAIYDTNLDTAVNLRKVYGLETTKDRPCNLIMDFFVTPDKRLHMNVKSRSGDVLWGFGSINIFEWTFYQEMILQFLQDEIDPDVTMGGYNHHVTNLHLYDFSGAQGYAVVENKLKQSLGVQNFDRLVFPDVDFVHSYFKFFVARVNTFIEEGRTDYTEMVEEMTRLFTDNGIPTEDNLLYDYMRVTVAYTAAKNMKLPKGIKTPDIEVNLDACGPEFVRAIANSKFRKFTIYYNGVKQ